MDSHQFERKKEVDKDAEGVKIFIINKTEGNNISE